MSVNKDLIPQTSNDQCVICPHCGEAYRAAEKEWPHHPLTWVGDKVYKMTCDNCMEKFYYWKRVLTHYCASAEDPKPS